jgi:23S rRNA pseudouridine1911/1915/1917 synthase
MHDPSVFTILVDAPDSGKRLDLLVASRISGCSRSVAASLIRNGKIRVQGDAKKPGYRTKTGDEICGTIQSPEPVLFKPEPIPIDILYQDDDIIVVNKPPGIVVHPAPGHHSGTLVNALLYHCPEIEGIGGEIRSGIVHRLDKDTSGLLVVAKNDEAHHNLAPIGRHPVDRKKMSTRSRKSRAAETTWKIKERFDRATLVELNLQTGRTHQIRVHFAAINHPIVGDPVYGGRKAGRKVEYGKDLFISVSRQMLHARRLGFTHPVTQENLSFGAPIPPDIGNVLKKLVTV